MFEALTFLLASGLVALHLAWRRKCRQCALASANVQARIAELQEQHRQEAIHARAQQEALFNSMIEGVLVLDTDGRIELINQSLARMFGLEKDIRGQKVLEVFRYPALVEISERLLAQGATGEAEFDLRDPSLRTVQVSATPVLDREGTRLGGILMFHDVSRIKELENTRQEFVANVSHELRTPLSMIKGFAETLLSGAKDDPQLAERFLKTIDKHADRLGALIDDLLTISRLESGRVVLNLQPVRIHKLTAKVLEDLRVRALERSVRLTNCVPPDLEAAADAGRIEQVIFNLVDNAIKYGRTDGNVTVGAEALKTGGAQIWVQDDGPGIPPEATERIFERFFRVDKARSREQGGTGLGLSIVKHIVQSHGGEVRVQSEQGRGAVFYFSLPP
jgi:two-component system, OmpR family, phosphate regulon sensor histidine kinase PhoR